MGKAIGFTLALVLTFTLTAAAEQAGGRIKSVDRDEHVIVFDDGTKLWVSDGYLTNLEPGDQVLVMYETQGGKKTVTQVSRPSSGPDGWDVPHFGVQAGD